MSFGILFLVLLLPIKDYFKVIDRLLKTALSTGHVIFHCSPLRKVVLEVSTVKSAVQSVR